MVRTQNRNQNSMGEYSRMEARRSGRSEFSRGGLSGGGRGSSGRGGFGGFRGFGSPAGGGAGRGGGVRSQSGRGKNRLMIQSAVSLVILMTIIAVFTWPGDSTAKAKAVIRDYLVEDYGMTPVFNFVDTVMAWGDALEWTEGTPAGQAGSGTLPRDVRPPAADVTLPADGKVLPVADMGADSGADGSAQDSLTARITSGDWLEDSLAVSADGGQGSAAAGLWIETAPDAVIRAAMAGTVNASAQEETGLYTLELACADGWSFRYSHLSGVEAVRGDQVKQGQTLGRAGKSSGAAVSAGAEAGGQASADGQASAGDPVSKVCVEVYYNGSAIDPISFFLGGEQGAS